MYFYLFALCDKNLQFYSVSALHRRPVCCQLPIHRDFKQKFPGSYFHALIIPLGFVRVNGGLQWIQYSNKRITYHNLISFDPPNYSNCTHGSHICYLNLRQINHSPKSHIHLVPNVFFSTQMCTMYWQRNYAPLGWSMISQRFPHIATFMGWLLADTMGIPWWRTLIQYCYHSQLTLLTLKMVIVLFTAYLQLWLIVYM